MPELRWGGSRLFVSCLSIPSGSRAADPPLTSERQGDKATRPTLRPTLGSHPATHPGDPLLGARGAWGVGRGGALGEGSHRRGSMNRWITPAVIHKSMGSQGGSLGWVAGWVARVGRGVGRLALSPCLSQVRGGSAARDPPGTNTHTRNRRDPPTEPPVSTHPGTKIRRSAPPRSDISPPMASHKMAL